LKEPWQQSDEESASSSLKNGDAARYLGRRYRQDEAGHGSGSIQQFAINLALAEEAGLRERNPDHPLLKLLDAHRSREEKGFF
jgi:hypothetical protein